MNAPFRAVAAFLATLLIAEPALALTPYTIVWTQTQFHNFTYNSCSPAKMATDGDTFFKVNGLGLRTWTQSAGIVPSGDDQMIANAAFDSSLLNVGLNDFHFGIATSDGADYCTHSSEVAMLTSPVLAAAKPLFKTERHGSSFIGNTTLDLTLLEINPTLSKAITNLNAAIETQKTNLVADAANVANLGGKLDALAALKTELNDLVERPLDEIATEDLDAILSRYGSIVDAGTRSALESLLNDLKRSVQDLRQELDRLLTDFRNLSQAAEDLATQAARQAGWNPEDPANYTVAVDANVPAVDVPDLSTTYQPYDAGTDPYGKYAQSVIDRLKQSVQADKVVVPTDFLGEVRAARRNFKAIEDAMRKRAVLSRAETAAFTAAQERVNTFIRQFMDDKDWLRNNPVPANVRAYVDGVLLRQFPTITPGLKDVLNRLREADISARTEPLLATIEAIGAGAEGVADNPFDDVEQFAADYQAKVGGALAQATSILKGILGGLAGVAPTTGDFIDVCETVTGRELCDYSKPPSLKLWERAASGLGWIAGSGKMWRSMGFALGGVAAAVIDKIAKRADDLRELTKLERALFETRFGKKALMALDGFDGKAMTALGKRFKDEFISRVAPTLRGDGMREFQALSYLKIQDAKKAELAAKSGAAVKALPRFEGSSLTDIRSVLSNTPGWRKTADSDAVKEFWVHPDGSLVRIALVGTTERDFMHVKKEIGSVPLSTDFGVAVAKVTDDGLIVPPGSATVETQTKAWFRRKVEGLFGGSPVINDRPTKAELDELVEVGWGDATHIRINP